MQTLKYIKPHAYVQERLNLVKSMYLNPLININLNVLVGESPFIMIIFKLMNMLIYSKLSSYITEQQLCRIFIN